MNHRVQVVPGRSGELMHCYHLSFSHTNLHRNAGLLLHPTHTVVLRGGGPRPLTQSPGNQMSFQMYNFLFQEGTFYPALQQDMKQHSAFKHITTSAAKFKNIQLK